MHLPAILVREKLLRSGVPKLCRMPETNASGSAVKNREPSTRPQSCICALRFLMVKIGLRSEVSDFPALPKTAIKTHCPKAKTRQIPFGKQPLKRENRLSAVPADQAGRTVARLHHSYHFKGKPGAVNPMPRSFRINL